MSHRTCSIPLIACRAPQRKAILSLLTYTDGIGTNDGHIVGKYRNLKTFSRIASAIAMSAIKGQRTKSTSRSSPLHTDSVLVIGTL